MLTCPMYVTMLTCPMHITMLTCPMYIAIVKSDPSFIIHIIQVQFMNCIISTQPKA